MVAECCLLLWMAYPALATHTLARLCSLCLPNGASTSGQLQCSIKTETPTNTAKNMYRNHRVHLLTPNREPSRHQNVPTVSHGPSRNIISQSQYLKATSQRYADFSRFSSIFYFHQALGERTDGGTWTIITTCVLQLAVDEASSNQPFHPLLVLLSLECAFCLFGGV